MRTIQAICLALAFLPACSGDKDDFSCTTNTKVVSYGANRCFKGTAILSEGKDSGGNASEEIKLNFADPNGGGFDVYASTVPYQPPFTSIGKLQTGVDYVVNKNHAYIVISSILKLNSGSVKFSSFDRTARKVSGSFEFTYTVNNSSGNFDTTITGNFSDVSY